MLFVVRIGCDATVMDVFSQVDDDDNASSSALESTSSTILNKKPHIGVVYSSSSSTSSHNSSTSSHNSSTSTSQLPIPDLVRERKSANRVLYQALDDTISIRQVTDKPSSRQTVDPNPLYSSHSHNVGKTEGSNLQKGKTDGQAHQTVLPDAQVRQLKDQLIRAKVYLTLPAVKNNQHLTRELRLQIKEVQHALGDATKDSELQRNALEKMKAMDQTLAKSKQMQDDCAVVVKKLQAMLHSTEEQL